MSENQQDWKEEVFYSFRSFLKDCWGNEFPGYDEFFDPGYRGTSAHAVLKRKMPSAAKVFEGEFTAKSLGAYFGHKLAIWEEVAERQILRGEADALIQSLEVVRDAVESQAHPDAEFLLGLVVGRFGGSDAKQIDAFVDALERVSRLGKDRLEWVCGVVGQQELNEAKDFYVAFWKAHERGFVTEQELMARKKRNRYPVYRHLAVWGSSVAGRFSNRTEFYHWLVKIYGYDAIGDLDVFRRFADRIDFDLAERGRPQEG